MADVLKTLDEPNGGMTNIAEALRTVRTQLYTGPMGGTGDRDDAVDVVILMTDGTYLKNRGIYCSD